MSMKPQILDLESEALAEFRERFNFAMSSLIGNMIEKGLKTGEVGGKIRIEINQVTDRETGELVLMPVIKPDVHMKVGAKGKIDCGTVEGVILKRTPCGQPVVASNQITFDELLEMDGKGA